MPGKARHGDFRINIHYRRWGFVVGQMRWLTTGTLTHCLGPSSVSVSGDDCWEEGCVQTIRLQLLSSVFPPHGLVFHLETKDVQAPLQIVVSMLFLISSCGRCFVWPPKGIGVTAAYLTEACCRKLFMSNGENCVRHCITQDFFFFFWDLY